jgi:low temperature requirement protein LtrA
MPERFGLFTLTVLGESVIAVSTGTAGASWTLASAFTAACGFALAAALWWMYFARFDDAVFNRAQTADSAELRRAFVCGCGHLAVFPALTAVGVGIRLQVEDAIAGRSRP